MASLPPAIGFLGIAGTICKAVGNAVRRWLRAWLLDPGSSPVEISLHISLESTSNVTIATEDGAPTLSTTVAATDALNETDALADTNDLIANDPIVRAYAGKVAATMCENNAQRMQALAERYPSDYELGLHSIFSTIGYAPHLVGNINAALSPLFAHLGVARTAIEGGAIVDPTSSKSPTERLKDFLDYLGGLTKE